MPLLRRYRNIASVPLEIHEVGKPIKKRIPVQPGQISSLVHVSPELHKFLTDQTGFAQVMEEEEKVEEIPEGFVETTKPGDINRNFRPMTAEEKAASIPAPLKPPLVTPESKKE